MGRIASVARRFGVSKNDVLNILVAGQLARGATAGPDDQEAVDALVAAALTELRREELPP
jgi:hypothetical protein